PLLNCRVVSDTGDISSIMAPFGIFTSEWEHCMNFACRRIVDGNSVPEQEENFPPVRRSVRHEKAELRGPVILGNVPHCTKGISCEKPVILRIIPIRHPCWSRMCCVLVL